MHAAVSFLRHFSKSDSVFFLTPSLFCSFSRNVLTALVFVLHPDSLMMSGACLEIRFKIQVPSSLINSNSEYTV